MANKTLYIKDADLPIWKAAEKLSEGSLSSYITSLLKKEVCKSREEVEKDQEGYHEIVVVIDHDHDSRKVSFVGKWLVEGLMENTSSNIADTQYSIAMTAKKRFVVFSEKLGKKEFHTYKTFNSFDELKSSKEVPPGIVHSVAKVLGREDIEYLDI